MLAKAYIWSVSHCGGFASKGKFVKSSHRKTISAWLKNMAGVPPGGWNSQILVIRIFLVTYRKCLTFGTLL